MKNQITALVVALAVIFGFACKAPQVVVAEPQATAQIDVESKPGLEDWFEPYFANFDLTKMKSAPTLFYNTAAIDMGIAGGNSDQETVYDPDGSISVNSDKIARSVKKMTAGKLISVAKNTAGKVTQMKISFDMEDKTFELTFILASDNRFYLGGKPDSKCWLQFNLKETTNQATKVATGWSQ